MRRTVPEDFVELLRLHADCGPALLESASRMSPSDVECSPDTDARRVRRMVWEVQNESHMLRSFVRLSPIGPAVLVGHASPRHAVGPRVCATLAHRFPRVLVCIGDSASTWLAYFDGERVYRAVGPPLAEATARLREATRCADVRDLKPLWESFYWSQYRPTRHSDDYFNKVMPVRYRAEARSDVERTNRKTLDEFK